MSAVLRCDARLAQPVVLHSMVLATNATGPVQSIPRHILPILSDQILAMSAVRVFHGLMPLMQSSVDPTDQLVKSRVWAIPCEEGGGVRGLQTR